MSVTVYVQGDDGIEEIVFPQAASVDEPNTGQQVIVLRAPNGQTIGAVTAANIIAAVADEPVMRP